MTPEEQLKVNVETVVKQVIDRFPAFVRDFVKPHADKLVINIVKTSQTYVEDKINLKLYGDDRQE